VPAGPCRGRCRPPEHRAGADRAHRPCCGGTRRLCEILDRFPHPTGGSLQFETGDTYRQLAAAELTRLDEPDPDLWSAIATTASYAYWRLYAEARRAEALLALGLAEEGGAELEAARARAQQLGAGGIRRLLDTVRSESPS